jgi:hypothetical protein
MAREEDAMARQYQTTRSPEQAEVQAILDSIKAILAEMDEWDNEDPTPEELGTEVVLQGSVRVY